MEWFKNLSTVWKVVLIGVVLIVAVWVFDLTTGYVRDIKNWAFDNRQARIEKQNEELTAENIKLRAERDEAARQALATKAKDAVLDEREKNLDARTKQQLENTEKALEAQAKEEAETEVPIDDYTRCMRVKEKMLAFNPPIPAAKNFTCEEKR